jgi:16S rRNA C1402 (ribose-2'-O) methylase RsmI
MTKFYEEYIRTAVDDLKPFQKTPKGELTLVISENISQLITLSESDKKNIKKMIQNLSIKDIINLITKEKKIPKKEIYNYCLSLKK